MTHRHRVLQIAGTASGGAWFVRQVVELQRRGHEVVAVVPDIGPLADELHAAGVPTRIVRFKGGRLVDLPRLIGAQVQLIRLVRSIRPAIVHAHLFKAILMGRVAGWLGGAPVVSQWPGDVHLDVPLLRRLDRLTMGLDAATLGSNRAIAERYRALGARRVHVAYYGLPVSEWDPDAPGLADAGPSVRAELGIGPEEMIVTLVAHLYPTRLEAFRRVGVKGHETLIAAARRLVSERSVRFLIVGDELTGDGSYRRSLEASVSRLGIDGAVTFLGHRDDVARIIAASDVITVPSMRESASYAAIQALLLRRPVVASRVGGLPDTVQDEETGLLVPPGDPESLAAAIGRLLDSPAERERMGRLGRERARLRFDLGATVDAVEAVYRAVLDEKAGA